MGDLDLRTIHTFLLIAQELSFAKAASTLHLSQPTVTARIQSLEAELGKTLFIRQHRSVHLTVEGQAFIPFAMQLLAIEKAAHEKLKSLNEVLEGKVVIGATATCSSYILPEILSDLYRTHPQIEFKVVTGKTSEITELLLQNMVDLGMVSSNVKTKQVKQMNLCCYNYDLVCSPDHPLTQKREVGFTDILEMPLVTFEQNSDAWKKIKKLYAQFDSVPNVVMELNQIEAAKAMVSASLCLSLFPNISVRRELEEERLIKIRVREFEAIKQYYSIIYMEKKESYPLIHFILNRLSKHFTNETSCLMDAESG